MEKVGFFEELERVEVHWAKLRERVETEEEFE